MQVIGLMAMREREVSLLQHVQIVHCTMAHLVQCKNMSQLDHQVRCTLLLLCGIAAQSQAVLRLMQDEVEKWRERRQAIKLKHCGPGGYTGASPVGASVLLLYEPAIYMDVTLDHMYDELNGARQNWL